MVSGLATDQPRLSSVVTQSGSVKEDCLRRLMVRYQQEDRGAADRLIYRLTPALTGYLYYANVPTGDRDDILQECWMRIHRSRHNYQDTLPVLPWVFAFLRHTRLDAYRRTRRRRSREIAMTKLPEERPARRVRAFGSAGATRPIAGISAPNPLDDQGGRAERAGSRLCTRLHRRRGETASPPRL